MSQPGHTRSADHKQSLRAGLLAARRTRRSAERSTVAEALAAHVLALPVVARARRVAAYRSMAEEPGTDPLLEGLLGRGVEVVVPVVLDGTTMQWVRHDPAADVQRSRLGVDEPVGAVPVADGLARCDVVILPALAADHAGHRLGRGAGYFDRALADVVALPRRPVLVAVVHGDELLPSVPVEPHDVPVDMVVTENGIFRVP